LDLLMQGSMYVLSEETLIREKDSITAVPQGAVRALFVITSYHI
jgi:hypothetical protein